CDLTPTWAWSWNATDVGCISKETSMKKLLLIGTVMLLTATSALAQSTLSGAGRGCYASSWNRCATSAQIRSWVEAKHRERGPYCNNLCQSKCDAFSQNPKACYAKWNKINAKRMGK